jgi:crotonobetainyl-CoA:carnitine CoA-transferase CaiB-like acyl-CoA transferase
MATHEQNPLTPHPLDGVRVLDLADKSCVYASKMLADLGAEVVRIEPPEGDAMRQVPPLDAVTGESLFYAYMNANKRSVMLDLDTPSGQTMFRRLAGSAGIVVESCPPGYLAARGIGHGDISATARGDLVWTTITPFGSEGPRANWLADDLVIQAIGGLLTLTGLPEREPLRLFGEQSCYITGLHAAAGTLLAHWHAVRTGLGQHVDVSAQECITHTLESAIQVYATEGVVRGRQPGRVEAGVGMFPCVDGEIFVYANARMIASSWHNMVKWLKEENIEGAGQLDDPKWLDLVYRRTDEARRIAGEVITRLTAPRSKYQLYDQLQRRHILCAPMSRIGDLFNNPQLKFLNWFTDQPIGGRMVTWPGPPFRMSETPRRSPGPVAAPGADNAAMLPAAGLAGRAKETAE